MMIIIVNIIIVFSTNGSKKQKKAYTIILYYDTFTIIGFLKTITKLAKINNEIMKKIKLNQKEKKKKKTSKKYTNIQHKTDGGTCPTHVTSHRPIYTKGVRPPHPFLT